MANTFDFWAAGALAVLMIAPGCSKTKEPTSDASCISCHRPDGVGIEEPHPWVALACTDCHGGNGAAFTLAEAHAKNVDGVASLRTLSTAQLDLIDRDFLRFMNPSDFRVANIGCGAENGQAGGTGCHQGLIEASKRSMHSTLAGITTVPRYNGGLQDDRLARFGAVTLEDPDYDPSIPYTVPSIQQVEVTPTDGLGPNNLPDFLGHTMAKRCTKCHLNVYGGGVTEFGNYRASGCAGCHMVYDNDGLSKSDDPVLDRFTPAHPVKHQLTSAIPDAQCEHCHWRGNRVGTAYKGWRERPAGSRDVKENTLRNESPLHTRGADFFIIDEDTTNDVDETPPDVHFTMGLGCIDCHLGPDNHGDGRIHTTMDVEGKVECEDCHGSFASPVQEIDGQFVGEGGTVMRHLSRGSDGKVKLTSLLDQSEHPVTQLPELTSNANLAAAHNNDHAQLECYACHTAWSQNCYGCHTNLDLRKGEGNLINGRTTPGKTAGNRDVVTLDNIHLAINTDGKIGIFMVQNMFFSVIVPCDTTMTTTTATASACNVDPDGLVPGKTLIDSQVRTSSEGKLGFSWGPGVPHTTATKDNVQPCDRCHFKEDGSNEAAVRLVYGFGNGQYTFTDGVTGIEHDLTKMIDENGEPVVAFAHVGTGPIPIERIMRAMNFRVP